MCWQMFLLINVGKMTPQSQSLQCSMSTSACLTPSVVTAMMPTKWLSAISTSGGMQCVLVQVNVGSPHLHSNNLCWWRGCERWRTSAWVSFSGAARDGWGWQYFPGTTAQSIFVHYVPALAGRKFLCVGMLVAVSLANGGLGFACLYEAVYTYLPLLWSTLQVYPGPESNPWSWHSVKLERSESLWSKFSR